MALLFCSTEGKGDVQRQMGKAHYSYRLVAQRFSDALARAGHRVASIDLPEKFKRPDDIAALSPDRDDAPIHIAFRSAENIRPMPPAFNICHFAWEFDILKDRELISGAITANQRHMLGLVDELWTPCAFTRDTLLRYGLRNVYVVPTPVCGITAPLRMTTSEALGRLGWVATACLAFSSGLGRDANADLVSSTISPLSNRPAIRTRMEGRGRIYLTVCNPGDLRKNLIGLIEGFVLASGDSPEDVLIVKLVVPNGGPHLDTLLYDHLRPRFEGPSAIWEPRVLFVSEFLNDEEMRALYSLADFYVCASHCEGQNLPLMEAMAHGTVAISTCNTAMLDYMDEDVGVPIAERSFLGAVPGLASDATGQSAAISMASRFDIARAISAARSLDGEDYRRLADRGRDRMVERFGEAAVMRLVSQRLDAIARRKERPADA